MNSFKVIVPLFLSIGLQAQPFTKGVAVGSVSAIIGKTDDQRVKYGVLAGLVYSSSVELNKKSPELENIILSTTGSLVGACAINVIHKLWINKRRKHKRFSRI
jgi:hypothetical protein